MNIENLKDEELLQEIKKAELEDVQGNNMQLALKILLNGGYGAVSNIHFLYYLLANAEAITLSGQLVNKWTNKRVNEFLDMLCGTEGINRTIAGDTDSIYLCLDDIVAKMGIQDKDPNYIATKLDEFCSKILSPKIDSYTDELAQYMNAVKNKMVWEREVIAPEAIYVRKKGYAMNVIDSEGVRFKDPKLKVVGLEAVKAKAFPAWARNYLKECYKIGLSNDQDKLHERVEQIREEFYKMPINEIAIPRGVNGVEKYTDRVKIYASGTPKHTKGAIIHNWLVDKKNLKISKIKDGSKIKFIDLKKPNPINQEVIAFERFLPAEFGLDKYVDKDTIFELSFLGPLQIFLNSIGWTHEPVITLF